MNVEVRRYRKPDGYPTRYWAVYVDGELLAVMLYRKGAEAVAGALRLRVDPQASRVGDELK
jgi:hypothetical protein